MKLIVNNEDNEDKFCNVCYHSYKYLNSGLFYVPTISINVCNDCLIELHEDLTTVKYDRETEFLDTRWTEAINEARYMLVEYTKIPTGMFGANEISILIFRYENGDRTMELLEELEGIQ